MTMTAPWVWICCLLLIIICGMTRGDSLDTSTGQCHNGKPQCPTDFKYARNSCTGTGQISCTRYVWNREQMKGHSNAFPIAQRRNLGTSICVTVKPTKDTRFTIDLEDGRNIMIHFDVRTSVISTKTIALNERKDGNWGKERQFFESHWPFSIGSETTIRIVSIAQIPPKALLFYINGKIVALWVELWTPLQQADRVSVWGDAQFMGVNTLCRHSSWRPA